MMKPNSWPEKQHDHLQGELKGQRNLERLQSDVIKYINMFSHLPARTKLYELCLCRREDAGMWKIVKWNESCHQGAADWFWPPAKRALIGCWPLNATAPQFSGVELIMLIAKDWKTNICILKQKDILACLPLIRLSIGVAPVCVHACVSEHSTGWYMSSTQKYSCFFMNNKLRLELKTVSHPHKETQQDAIFATINFRCCV